MPITKSRLNCFCARRPLLAVYGVDERGRVYVHVKVYKQRRVFAEMLVLGGTVLMSCRECLRWHKVIFRTDNKAELHETQAPREIKSEEGGNDRSSPSGD